MRIISRLVVWTLASITQKSTVYHERTMIITQNCLPVNLTMSFVLATVAASILMTSCGASVQSAEDQALVEAANQMSLESDSLFNLARLSVEDMQQQVESLERRGDELSAEEIAYIEAVAGLAGRLEAWQQRRAAIPGAVHQHVHDGNCTHDHSHGNDMQLTPTDNLAIQQELRTDLTGILEACRQVSGALQRESPPNR